MYTLSLERGRLTVNKVKQILKRAQNRPKILNLYYLLLFYIIVNNMAGNYLPVKETQIKTNNRIT